METQTKKQKLFEKPWAQSTFIIIGIFTIVGLFLFWIDTRHTVFIENSEIDAPILNLSSAVPGILNTIYVHVGDNVQAGDKIALVGSQTITTSQDGVITSAPNLVGQYFNPGQTVATLVNPKELKVIGTIEENKGLKNISNGDAISFTVDAFPGKTYKGYVNEVSLTSKDSGVVFSISDARPIKKFEIKATFDDKLYPELRNGMSAKITVYTQK
jgi:multidrug resistance efflux pump